MRFPELLKIFLKLMVQFQGVIGRKARSNDHVANVNRIRKNGIILELFKSHFRLVMIHNEPCFDSIAYRLEPNGRGGIFKESAAASRSCAFSNEGERL